MSARTILLVFLMIVGAQAATTKEHKGGDSEAEQCTPDLFKKPSNRQADNVISVCPFVYGIKRSQNESQVSLEECKAEACRRGGNVINYLPTTLQQSRPSECQVRMCNSGPVMPMRLFGGWDVYRRHKFGSCTMDGFLEEFREEDGFQSDCATLRMIEVESKEECMNATCGLGGTVFNYKSGEGRSRCVVKLCDLNGIHVDPFRGGWDVYHTQRRSGKCENTFVKLYDRLVGVATHCIFRGHGTVSNMAGCAKLACEAKANVFNYRGNVCFYERCNSPWLKVISRHGWQLYTTRQY